MEILGCTIIDEDPTSGESTIKLDSDTLEFVIEWHLGPGHDEWDLEESGLVRDFDGSKETFTCGGNYDVISEDLLGGGHNGDAHAAFQKRTGHKIVIWD